MTKIGVVAVGVVVGVSVVLASDCSMNDIDDIDAGKLKDNNDLSDFESLFELVATDCFERFVDCNSSCDLDID